MNRNIGYRFVILFLAIILGVTGCRSDSEAEVDFDQSELKTLKVYVVGDAVNTQDDSGNTVPVYYFTSYVVGDYESSRFGYGYEGHIWYEMLKRYQEETNTKLDIEYFAYPEQLEEQLISDSTTDDGPDLVLNTFTSYADYNSLMKQQYFADITEYMGADEMYTSGEYYEPVLQGGQYDGKQYLMPMLFNFGAVMSSEENLQQYDLRLHSEMSLHEIISQFIQNMQQQEGTLNYETVTEQLGGPSYYTTSVLYGAAGESGINYEAGEVQLDFDLFEDLCLFTKALYQQQFGTEWESFVQNPEQKLDWTKTIKVNRMLYEPEARGEVIRAGSGSIIEGGSCLNMYLHSVAAQATYYESRFRDEGKDFYIQELPTWNGELVANISAFGAVMADSQNPEAAYHLLKYLADQEYFFHLGLSVNREKTKKILDDLTSTEYEINNVFGHIPMDEYQADYKGNVESYTIQPMSADTRKFIETALEDITSGTVPDWPVYGYYKQVIDAYCRDQLTIQEAYEKLEKDLNLYLESGYQGGMVY